MCLFRFTWINDLNDEGKLLITCFCLASVNCGPRTVVAGVNVVREYYSVRELLLRVLAQAAQAQRIGKITRRQQAKTRKVNTVSCILLNILASIYRFESFTWIPIQILYIHGHFKLRNMKLHDYIYLKWLKSHTELGRPVVLVFRA